MVSWHGIRGCDCCQIITVFLYMRVAGEVDEKVSYYPCF